ncbi:ankyrin repeats [Ceratobasidium sp. AG-Ba]|nr:ankyrin repeats [Ceratobasidium sp. AG-Ba]
MVSALWNACASATEDVEHVRQLLSEPGVELEIKDQAGTTPLIQALKNGHNDVAKALLAAGADPANASPDGRPETYTTDPEMLALLQPKQPSPQEGYPPPHDPNAPYNPMAYYYPVPPGHEGPYPPYGYPMLPPPDGQPPVPAFAPAGDGTSNGVPNLPPADIARTIPCRYFPVCRYGSSCMFLHPQPPYFSGPPPPAPAHYPPMYPPHGYYMMRPGSYPPPPPGAPPVEPVASPVTGTQPFPPPGPLSYPPPPPANAPPFSPGANGTPFPPPPVNGAPPFSNGAPYPPPVNGAPYPPPAAGTPYTPISAGTPSPFGQPPFSPGSATPFSGGPPFTPGPVSAPYPYPRPYPEPPKDAPEEQQQQQQQPVQQPQQSPITNGTGNHPNGAGGGYSGRRPTRGNGNGAGGRRESFGTSRQPKPACLFFPSGRCRNGDECRFPHVLPEPGSQPQAFGNRYPPNGNGRYNNNGGNNHRSRQSISHHDGPPPAHIPPGTKLPFADEPTAQKVPSPDDFPVLGSKVVNSSNANGTGLTAAQVLQAPAPAKKKAEADVGVNELADALSKVHVNGLAAPAFEATPTTPEITAVGA